eukprot:5814234-Pyramimonas_sp.AAC.1
MKCSASGDNAFTKEFICGQAVDVGSALHVTLKTLDAAVNDSRAVELEKSGWVLNEPIATMRAWCLLAAIFSKRLEEVILKSIAKLLTDQSDALTKVTPPWSACFADD